MKFNQNATTVNHIEEAIDLNVKFNNGYVIELSSEYLELINNIKTRLLKISVGNNVVYSTSRKREVIEINKTDNLFVEYDLVFIENGQEYSYYGSVIIKPTSVHEVINLSSKKIDSNNMVAEVEALHKKINNLSVIYDNELKKYVSLQDKLNLIDEKIKTLQAEITKKA